MKAYLILAHKNPAQLERLIHALSDEQSSFFIHIDKASDIAQFSYLTNQQTNIHFLPQQKTTWASYGIVQAILNGMQIIRDTGLPFRHIILLSGQDYPIKSNAFINQFAEQHADKTFIEFFELPNPRKWQPDGGFYRVSKYFMGLKFYQRFSSKALNFLARYLPVLKRRQYGKMHPYAGSMWWMMNMPAVNHILEFVRQHPGYVAFHQYTFAPDELFFHTILLNAKDTSVSGSIVNSNMRFIKWKDISASHPEVMVKENLPEITGSPALFARKFDALRDAGVLDLIDHHRLSTQ